MPTELADRTCIPCQGGQPALGPNDIQPLSRQVPDWEVIADHHLSRNFAFADFASALAFVNRIGQVAEDEAHHPDVFLAWGKVGIELWTHAVDGLSESDFIVAAKIDRLPRA